MLASLGRRGSREWDLLDAIADGRLTVADLYDAYVAEKLQELRDKLADVDLQPFVAPWFASVKARISQSSDTHTQYLTKIRTLMPEGLPFFRSELTHSRISEWLAGLEWSSSTRRKYHAAISSFCEYLWTTASVITNNPARGVDLSPANPPRMRYLDHADVLRLVESHIEPFRTISALVHGTGVEISAALKLKCRDVDRARRELHAHGTKTAHRDRIVRVESWAWAYFERHIAEKLPNADLFPGIDRWTAHDRHADACSLAGIEDYTQHDARHT